MSEPDYQALRKERDELKAALATVRAELFHDVVETVQAALIRERAVAMEEAARVAELPDHGSTVIANDIRALAPLPASLVLVDRATLRGLLEMFPCVECGEQGRRHFTTEGDGPFWLCDSTDADHAMPRRYAGCDETRPLDAALALLAEVKP